MTPATMLKDGLARMRLALPAAAEEKLLGYLELLLKWNHTYNLTAIREPDKMVSHHLLDSLSVLPHLGEGSIADVGSGAGLPGIPLAIAQPSRAVILNDANHKKAAFLTQATIELGMTNATIVHSRTEEWHPDQAPGCVISRAFAELSDFLAATRHLAMPGTQLAAMKGVYPHDELARLPEGFRCEKVVPLEVPFVDGARHLVLCRKEA